jgi:hypothetical protein
MARDLLRPLPLRNYYYGWWQYQRTGIDPFLERVQAYLAGAVTIPVTRTKSLGDELVKFTFTNALMARFLKEDARLAKAYECAVKYGFRGRSRGGRGGIFLQRERDTMLRKRTDTLVATQEREVTEDLDIESSSLPKLARVKIVYPNRAGERVVGVMDGRRHRIIFVGLAKYSG